MQITRRQQLNFDSVNCECLWKGISIDTHLKYEWGNGNLFDRKATNLLDYEIIWMFNRNISYHWFSRIQLSVAYKIQTHTSIQNSNRALRFLFVKWAAVVQPTKRERRDVCTCDLSLSNDFHNLFNRKHHTWWKKVYRSQSIIIFTRMKLFNTRQIEFNGNSLAMDGKAKNVLKSN